MTHKEFEDRVAEILKGYVLVKIKKKHIAWCKKMYENGDSPELAARCILNDV